MSHGRALALLAVVVLGLLTTLIALPVGTWRACERFDVESLLDAAGSGGFLPAGAAAADARESSRIADTQAAESVFLSMALSLENFNRDGNTNDARAQVLDAAEQVQSVCG